MTGMPTPEPFEPKHSIIQQNLPVFGLGTESQSRLKVDEQKRAIFGTQEKEIGRHWRPISVGRSRGLRTCASRSPPAAR
jgi:hypothetical protein